MTANINEGLGRVEELTRGVDTFAQIGIANDAFDHLVDRAMQQGAQDLLQVEELVGVGAWETASNATRKLTSLCSGAKRCALTAQPNISSRGT